MPKNSDLYFVRPKKEKKVKVAQSCLTLCDPIDYTVHGVLQARILERGAIPFSRGSSQPRDWTDISCIVGGFFTSWATRGSQGYGSGQPILSPADLPHPGIRPGSTAMQAVFTNCAIREAFRGSKMSLNSNLWAWRSTLMLICSIAKNYCTRGFL